MKKSPLLLFLVLVIASGAVAQDRPSIVVAAEGIEWLPLDEAIETAERENKKILVDVYAPWCSYCRRMHLETYANPEVQKYLAQNYVATRVDGDDGETTYDYLEETLTGAQLAYHFGARGFPTTVFLQPDANYLTPLPGFLESTDFLSVLRYIASDAYETQDYRSFIENEVR